MKPSMLGTIFLGVAAGVAVGVLLASDKGSMTRKSFSDKADGFKKSLKRKVKFKTENIDDLAKMLEMRIEDARRKIDKLSEKLQTKIT